MPASHERPASVEQPRGRYSRPHVAELFGARQILGVQNRRVPSGRVDRRLVHQRGRHLDRCVLLQARKLPHLLLNRRKRSELSLHPLPMLLHHRLQLRPAASRPEQNHRKRNQACRRTPSLSSVSQHHPSRKPTTIHPSKVHPYRHPAPTTSTRPHDGSPVVRLAPGPMSRSSSHDARGPIHSVNQPREGRVGPCYARALCKP